MPARKIGYAFIGIGIFIVFFMLVADIIGLGSGGVQAAQLLGVEIGILIVLLGYFFIVTSAEKTIVGKEWRARIGDGGWGMPCPFQFRYEHSEYRLAPLAAMVRS